MSPRWLAAAFVLLHTACTSTSRVDDRPLPSMVAIIPFQASLFAAHTEPDDPEALPPTIDPSRVEQALLVALRSCFVDAVVLPYPPGISAAEFEQLAQGARESHWIAQAAIARADLIVDWRFSPAPGLKPSLNEKFALNVPLFLLGGPLCYFVDDVSYDGESRLRGVLHAVPPLVEGRATFTNEDAEVGRFEVRVDSVDLDFIDRAGPWHYAASILLPPGLLAEDTERSRRLAGAALVDALQHALEVELTQSRESLAVAERIAEFYLQPDAIAERRDGRIEVRGLILLRDSSDVALRELQVACGDAHAACDLSELEAAPNSRVDGYDSFPFEASLDADAGSNQVRLEIVQGGRQRVRRTFTLPIRSTPR